MDEQEERLQALIGFVLIIIIFIISSHLNYLDLCLNYK